MGSLYVHIPFCVRKCAYCDFTSFGGMMNKADGYIDCLIREMRERSEEYGRLSLDTVFFGGGTPSLLSKEQTGRIVDAIDKYFDLNADCEMTTEANPGTVDMEKLLSYRSMGFNRISLGVQSFDDGLLKSLGRIHTSDEAAKAVKDARSAGFDNINIDLMYALPHQTEQQLNETLEQAIRLDVPHVSCYSLIVEEGTPMQRYAEVHPEVFPDEDMCMEMQRTITARLHEGGIERYEISNYAKPGFECKHNIVYWRRGDYLGIGCAAHSMMNDVRFSNTCDLNAYLSGRFEEERSVLTETDIFEETVMLGLRMCGGIDETVIKGKNTQRLEDGGFARRCGGRFMLTEKGMEVMDAIVLQLTDGV